VRKLVLTVLCTVALSVGLTTAVTTSLTHSVPQCQEDEVLVGVGDFHHSGYWDSYRCQDAD
jgi:hypothetical protein